MPTKYDNSEEMRVRKLEYENKGRKSAAKSILDKALTKTLNQELEDKGFKRMIIGEAREPHIVVAEIEQPSLVDNIHPAEAQYGETIKEVIKEVEEKAIELSAKVEDVTKTMEDYALALHTIPDKWIEDYENETGMKAIWQGRMTNGFKEFILANGLLA